MINVNTINANPFERHSLWPSYSKNIGDTYPALLISNTNKEISVYDGIINVGGTIFALDDMLIGDLYAKLIELGVSCRVFRGMEHITALSIANFSNMDLTNEKILSSPIDLSDSVSEFIAKNIPGNYSDFVNIKVRPISNTKLIDDNILISQSTEFNKDIQVEHFAHTFVLMSAECNIIRDTKRIYKIPAVKDKVIKYNQRVFGIDNENVDI